MVLLKFKRFAVVSEFVASIIVQTYWF